MKENQYKPQIIALLERLGISYIESRICCTHSYDLLGSHSSYPRLSRSLASKVLKLAFTLNDELHDEPYEKAHAILTIAHLFDYIKSFGTYSELVSFVEGCKTEFNLKDLNSGTEFDFDNPVPAIIKPINEFLASDDFVNINWNFSLIEGK